MPLITRKTIVHQHFVLGMSPEEIAPLIPSPRSDTGGLSIKAVKSVIDFLICTIMLKIFLGLQESELCLNDTLR